MTSSPASSRPTPIGDDAGDDSAPDSIGTARPRPRGAAPPRRTWRRRPTRLFVDLEAGVPHDRLDDAREPGRASHAGDAPRRASSVVVRVNAVASVHIEADVTAVVREGLYGIALAKIDDARDVRVLDRMPRRPSVPAGMARGTVVIHPLIEDAGAVRKAYRIARASTRVAHMGGIVAPGGDLARSIGFGGSFSAPDTRYVREKVLVDARAAGVRFPLSGIPVERDEDELRAAVARLVTWATRACSRRPLTRPDRERDLHPDRGRGRTSRRRWPRVTEASVAHPTRRRRRGPANASRSPSASACARPFRQRARSFEPHLEDAHAVERTFSGTSMPSGGMERPENKRVP